MGRKQGVFAYYPSHYYPSLYYPSHYYPSLYYPSLYYPSLYYPSLYYPSLYYPSPYTRFTPRHTSRCGRLVAARGFNSPRLNLGTSPLLCALHLAMSGTCEQKASHSTPCFQGCCCQSALEKKSRLRRSSSYDFPYAF